MCIRDRAVSLLSPALAESGQSLLPLPALLAHADFSVVAEEGVGPLRFLGCALKGITPACQEEEDGKGETDGERAKGRGGILAAPHAPIRGAATAGDGVY
eukprot:9495373-Pyramimonas_sp.AAC.1